MTSASLTYCSTKNTNLLIQVLNVTRASIVIKASSGHQRAGGMKESTQDLNHISVSTVMNGFIGGQIARDMNGYTQGQEYPTELLDKIPALQAEFELAGKKTLAN